MAHGVKLWQIFFWCKILGFHSGDFEECCLLGCAVCCHLLTLIPRSHSFLPWRWRRYVPLKRLFTQDLHCATSQKKTFFKSFWWLLFLNDRELNKCNTHRNRKVHGSLQETATFRQTIFRTLKRHKTMIYGMSVSPLPSCVSGTSHPRLTTLTIVEEAITHYGILSVPNLVDLSYVRIQFICLKE
jgi:hypothetical protein